MYYNIYTHIAKSKVNKETNWGGTVGNGDEFPGPAEVYSISVPNNIRINYAIFG